MELSRSVFKAAIGARRGSCLGCSTALISMRAVGNRCLAGASRSIGERASARVSGR